MEGQVNRDIICKNGIINSGVKENENLKILGDITIRVKQGCNEPNPEAYLDLHFQTTLIGGHNLSL